MHTQSVNAWAYLSPIHLAGLITITVNVESYKVKGPFKTQLQLMKTGLYLDIISTGSNILYFLNPERLYLAVKIRLSHYLEP